jgi:hypothetical protein
MGLFGGRSEAKHPNFDLIAEALQTYLGLQLVPPGEDVLAVLDQLTQRELNNFGNLHSIEGMQELFRVRSIRAVVEQEAQTVSLSIADQTELQQEITQEHSQRRTMHFEGHHSAAHIAPPKDMPIMGATRPPASRASGPAETVAPLPHGFEHLEAMEHLLPQVTDLFVRYGRLNTGDKDVLKKIIPLDSTVEARLTALERWQAEVSHRMRGLRVPHAQGHVMLGGESAQQLSKPEEVQARRFETFTIWMSKLIKAFEHTGGVKFHNKPMWLPHT